MSPEQTVEVQRQRCGFRRSNSEACAFDFRLASSDDGNVEGAEILLSEAKTLLECRGVLFRRGSSTGMSFAELVRKCQLARGEEQ